MHLYFYIRGIKQQTDIWVTLAQGQFWVWKRKNLKTRKIVHTLVQGALRPSIFGAWEYVFPEECLAEVLQHFGIADSGACMTATYRNKAKLIMLRKLFQVKKIPKEIFEEANKIPQSVTIKGHWRGICGLRVPGVTIHAIGTKKDMRKKVKRFGYEQEML